MLKNKFKYKLKNFTMIRPSFYRQSTLNIENLDIKIEKNNLHASRRKREFGKDITNISLNQQNNKSQNVVFFKALQSLIDNQNNPKNYTQKNSERDTEKKENYFTQIPTDYRNKINNKENQTKRIKSIEVVLDAKLKNMDIDSESKSEEIQEDSSTENPQDAKEYVDDILAHLRETECDFLCDPDYMNEQDDINDRMRAILIDWLVEVYYKFKLQPETLFLTCNLIDRYLSFKQIKRNKLQLVGVTALFIASKYEEIYPPELSKLVYITDNAYQREDVLEMEMDMLKTLDFNVTVPSPIKYLDFIKIKFNIDEFELDQILYLIFLNLLNGKTKQFPPFLLTIAAACIVCSGKKRELFEFYGKKDKFHDINLCMEELVKYTNKVNDHSFTLNGVKKIFSLTKFHQVAHLTYEC